MIDHLLYPLICERLKSEARYREGHLRVVNALPARCVPDEVLISLLYINVYAGLMSCNSTNLFTMA